MLQGILHKAEVRIQSHVHVTEVSQSIAGSIGKPTSSGAILVGCPPFVSSIGSSLQQRQSPSFLPDICTDIAALQVAAVSYGSGLGCIYTALA